MTLFPNMNIHFKHIQIFQNLFLTYSRKNNISIKSKKKNIIEAILKKNVLGKGGGERERIDNTEVEMVQCLHCKIRQET